MAKKPIEELFPQAIAEMTKTRDAVKKLKPNDFTSIDSTIGVVGADGAKQGVITPPAGVAAVGVGSTVKIKIAMPADPANLPQDGYQMSLNGSYLWIDKANNDIMQWREIKDHIASGDFMVLERLADTGGFKNYQLVKWEAGTKQGGHWETIDPATYIFTESYKVRITTTHFEMFVGHLSKYHNYYSIKGSIFSSTSSEKMYIWKSNKTDKTKLDRVAINYNNDPFKPTFTEDAIVIKTFEIWKEA